MKNRINFLDQMLLSVGLPFAAILFVITMIGLFTEKKIIVGAGVLITVVAFGITIIRSNSISKQMSQLIDIMSKLALDRATGEADKYEKISIEQYPNEKSKQLLEVCMMIAENQRNHLIEQKNMENDHKKAMEKQTTLLSKTINKINDYEAALDAIPYPVHILDINANEVFMNKAYETKMIEIGFIENRATAYGTKSCGNNIDFCNSEDCDTECSVCKLLANGVTQTVFEYEGSYSKIITEHIKDKTGENTGFIEMSLDLTESMSVNAYTKNEVSRIEKNLLKLAEGSLDFDMDIGEANAYTYEIWEQFSEIGKSLDTVRQSISNLISDSEILIQATLNGKLETRVVESQFKGSWKGLISGMNQILAEIGKPIIEVSGVMKEITAGNLKATVMGNYEGHFDELKQTVNAMGTQLTEIIDEISNVTGQIGMGNLNIESVRPYEGDFVNISNALNAIIDTLNALLKDINLTAEQVNVGANQVADGSQSLSQGSTEQASAVQELTASIEEIAQQTKHNAMDANKASELVASVMDFAEKGSQQMMQMQRSMFEINQSSKDISKIIKVIDDIAFQTNILALNAAVEAARAGQHGKGFAVVAEEVRTLAARSADAAKNTTLLIEGSIDKVQTGTKIADETANALIQIVEGIRKTTDIVENIAMASNDQASNIAQINTGIEQVAQVVQHNSATSEESAAASEELSDQAELLKMLINQFQLRVDLIEPKVSNKA